MNSKLMLTFIFAIALQSFANKDLSKALTDISKGKSVNAAIRTLEKLSEKSNLDKNLINLNLGRAYFQINKNEEAIQAYSKVEKSSDFWVESMEEKAWVYLKEKNYSKALAELKSIHHPLFASIASPESYMLSAFVDLKICNYKSVVEKIDLFKNQMLPRVSALEDIRDGKIAAKEWSELGKTKKLTLVDLGSNISQYPRYFYRNQKFLKNPNYIKTLARRDLKEIETNLKKMKIIEIELIHRTQRPDVQVVDSDAPKFDKSKEKDKLIFPVKAGSSEIWLDEIGKFEVQTSYCPGGKSL